MSRNEAFELKIHNGTGQLTGRPLCFSCKEAIIRGDDHVVCATAYPRPIQITKPIYRCNRYYNTSLPSLGDMKDVAWDLKIKGGRVVGFQQPKERRGDEPPEDW